MDGDHVHQKLDGKLLRQLLELEQKERQEQLQATIRGVQPPAAAAAAAGSNGSGPPAPGLGLPKPDDMDGSDEEWQRLLNSAPWLQQSDKKNDGSNE